MGNSCSASTTADNNSLSRGTSGPAKRVGGQTTDSDSRGLRGLAPGAAAAAAAEARAAAAAAKNGPSDERRRRDELVGRLRALYDTRGEAAPIGLATMSAADLSELYARKKMREV